MFIVCSVLMEFILYKEYVYSLLRPNGVYPIQRIGFFSLLSITRVHPIQRIGFQFTPSYWSSSYTEDRFLVYSVLLEFILYREQVSNLLRSTGVHPIQRICLQFTPSYWSSSNIKNETYQVLFFSSEKNIPLAFQIIGTAKFISSKLRFQNFHQRHVLQDTTPDQIKSSRTLTMPDIAPDQIWNWRTLTIPDIVPDQVWSWRTLTI